MNYQLAETAESKTLNLSSGNDSHDGVGHAPGAFPCAGPCQLEPAGRKSLGLSAVTGQPPAPAWLWRGSAKVGGGLLCRALPR